MIQSFDARSCCDMTRTRGLISISIYQRTAIVLLHAGAEALASALKDELRTLQKKRRDIEPEFSKRNEKEKVSSWSRVPSVACKASRLCTEEKYETAGNEWWESEGVLASVRNQAQDSV